jgi:hypothetical protein
MARRGPRFTEKEKLEDSGYHLWQEARSLFWLHGCTALIPEEVFRAHSDT